MSGGDLREQYIRTQGKYSDTNLLKNRLKKEKVSPQQYIRTQGKYSDTNLLKNRLKKEKVSPQEKNEKKSSKRYSNERRRSDEYSSMKYEEKSRFSFSELEEPKKPIEISDPGKHVISSTERGESLIYYKPDFLNEDEAWHLFDRIKDTTAWISKNRVSRGRAYPQPKLVAWYGPYPYPYSGMTLKAAEMPDLVLAIKQKIEAYLEDQGIKVEFNSVLLNLYRDEKDSVAWHSDNQVNMVICPTIASISLGEVRRFELRSKKRFEEENYLAPFFMNLSHGSLVVMDGCMQEDWQHRIPKEYHDKESRINLTFRTVFPIDKTPEKEFRKQYTASNTTENECPKRGMSDADKLYNKLSDREKKVADKSLQGLSDRDKSKAIGMLIELAHDPRSPWVRSPSPILTRRSKSDKPQNKQSNEIFKKEHDGDSGPHFKQGGNKRRNRFLLNQNHVGRGSTRYLNYDDRTNKQLDKEGERREDEVRRWKRDEKNDHKSWRRDENDERRRYERVEDLERRYWREYDEIMYSRGEDVERRYSSAEDDKKRYTRAEDVERRCWREDDDDEGRYKRDGDVERRYWRPEEAEGRYRVAEEDKRRWREDESDRFPQRQNDNAGRVKFSNLQNDDERQERNSETRDDDDRCLIKVLETQNGDRRNVLPPRYSNNTRNPPKYGVEDETLSGESLDNDKHARELVKKEHCESDHNKVHSNNTLNVAATEFVPRLQKPVLNYDQMSLKDLLDQDIELMNNYNNLQSYAKNLKRRFLKILEL